MLQDQIDQLREDFERERTQLVDQIDQKTSRLLTYDRNKQQPAAAIGALDEKMKHYC